ncbi:NFACT family protein [bacterium]|nr:NFACT family protein [bacterium]
MYNFDSLTLKYFEIEAMSFIKGATLQKIQMPSRHELILVLRNLPLKENKKLYININPKYPHVCFIDDNSSYLRNLQIPKNPPMFCMQLRKYLTSSFVKDFQIKTYDRILELYFDYVDEIGSIERLCLCCELMGKYSNIILYNAKNKIILGSAHNVSIEKSSTREVFGGARYCYPVLISKQDILNAEFSAYVQSYDNMDLSMDFYYLSNQLIEFLMLKFSKNDLFLILKDLCSFKRKDLLLEFWGSKKSINNAIDEYFSNIIFQDNLSKHKTKLTKIVNQELKKLSKILNIQNCEIKSQKYKQEADFIMNNLYNPENLKEYSNNPMEKANKLYLQYKKAKKSEEVLALRSKDAQEKSDYFNTILFGIENLSSYEEIQELECELSSLGIIQANNPKKSQIKVEKVTFENYDIYIGKNNLQNDYLFSKIAKAEDIWFHVLNCPSSHIILKINENKNPSKEVLEFCAKLAKQNSKAKNSSKTSIIFTKRKNLKHPPNTYPGYVTYKNEKEIII